MPRIDFSYEEGETEERSRFMGLIAPVLRNAKIKERPKKNRYHHVYIQYENPAPKAKRD